jgi:hypothetical protein
MHCALQLSKYKDVLNMHEVLNRRNDFPVEFQIYQRWISIQPSWSPDLRISRAD